MEEEEKNVQRCKMEERKERERVQCGKLPLYVADIFIHLFHKEP